MNERQLAEISEQYRRAYVYASYEVFLFAEGYYGKFAEVRPLMHVSPRHAKSGLALGLIDRVPLEWKESFKAQHE